MSTYLVIMLLMVTPVPIPNTKVKRQEAESTAREAVWEGKLLPGQCGSIAQSVEQRTENPRVDGSIPSGGTKIFLAA